MTNAPTDSDSNSLAPIEKQIDVPLSPDAAFDLFTRDMARWWPLDSFSISAHDGKTARGVRVDPREGGHITEDLADGGTATWATITDWSPGARFAFDWYVGRTAEEATQVDVVFVPIEGGTRVHLTHDGFDRMGDGAATMCNTYRSGWDMVLGQCYGTASRSRVAA